MIPIEYCWYSSPWQPSFGYTNTPRIKFIENYPKYFQYQFGSYQGDRNNIIHLLDRSDFVV